MRVWVGLTLVVALGTPVFTTFEGWLARGTAACGSGETRANSSHSSLSATDPS
jgi:hypothetical protein